MSDTHEPSSACDAVKEALGNRYEILSDLGEGSFGTVYKAKDKVLNRLVAVKSVRLDTSSDPATREELNKRFLREAQVAAQLNHPNIVTIHDIISTPSASLIVMEFVEGVSLRSILENKKRLALSEATDILSKVADALDYAHLQKVVHRDIKPANIMITPSHDVRVTDFGIAKTESSSDSTVAGVILGTPDYMSPEQARAVPLDGRSDLFSLGSVLYECLVGEKPFGGGTVTSVLLRIVSDDPAPEIDSKDLGLPSELDKVIKRALAKDPSKRYPTGAEFIEALRSLLPVEESNEAGATDAEDKETPAPTSRAEAMSSTDAEEVGRPEVSAETEEQKKTSQTGSSYLRTLREEERVLYFSTEDPNALKDLNLSPDEAYLVSRIDGTLKPRDIYAVSPLDEKETARTLLGLIESGVIRFKAKDSPSVVTRAAQAAGNQSEEKSAGVSEVGGRDQSPASGPRANENPDNKDVAPRPTDPSTVTKISEIERLYDLARFQDHAQFLGIPKDAGREEIQRAFRQKSAQFSSNAYPNISHPDFHDKLRHLLKLAYESYTALSKEAGKGQNPERESPATRQEETSAAPKSPNNDVARVSAEEIYIRAERAYENQDYWTAIELCRHAISLSKDEAKYHHLLGLALLQNENWRKEAEESLRRATELDPDNSEYFEVLGSLYQKVGLSSRAQEMFDKAKSNSN